VIDFLYHVVSIVAVFLALAVGIVLGSGPLKDDISGFLEDRTEQLANEKVDLQGEVSNLRSDLEYNEKLGEIAQPVLIDQLLATHVTTVVVLPDADGDQAGAVEDAIGAAGGSLGERVTIEPAWGDPAESDTLGRVAEGIDRGEKGEDSYQLASQVLADALLTPGGRTVGEPTSDGIAVLGAFEREGFITAEEDEVIRADTVVVVGPNGSMANADRMLVPMLAAFDEVGIGTVLSAPDGSDASGGVIGVLRGSDIDGVVSSDDRLETVSGVTVTIAALAEQVAGGVGHYGTGDGSDGPAPDPFPRG
jgi:hypothetical protein